ncbi:MAG: ABC transporter permease, partial [Phycisphaerales bacterium]|nr:ABC transporter permease [Phycisphaerales bacterium]
MIARLGASIRENVERFGVFVRFAAATLLAILSGTSSWARWSRLAPQLFLIGTRSIPVLGLTGATIGAILAIEGYDQFAQLGQEHRLGAVVNISVVKQIGPVLAAVMLAGRVGCALTAELGSMRVTEQIDA